MPTPSKRKRSDKESNKSQPNFDMKMHALDGLGPAVYTGEPMRATGKKPRPADQEPTAEDGMPFLPQLVSICNIALNTTNIYLDIEKLFNHTEEHKPRSLVSSDIGYELEHTYKVLSGLSFAASEARDHMNETPLPEIGKDVASWKGLERACEQLNELSKHTKAHSKKAMKATTAHSDLQDILTQIKACQSELMIAKHGLDPKSGCASYDSCVDDVKALFQGGGNGGD